MSDWALPKSCEECRAGVVEGWDRVAECAGGAICWWESDGGWAFGCWQLWQIVGELKVEPLTGHSEWKIDWHAFSVAVPADILADDDERFELMSALRWVQNRMQRPETSLEGGDDD